MGVPERSVQVRSGHGAEGPAARNTATTRRVGVAIAGGITSTGVLESSYAVSVQLSHRPRTQVLEERPSRSRGQG